MTLEIYFCGKDLWVTGLSEYYKRIEDLEYSEEYGCWVKDGRTVCQYDYNHGVLYFLNNYNIVTPLEYYGLSNSVYTGRHIFDLYLIKSVDLVELGCDLGTFNIFALKSIFSFVDNEVESYKYKIVDLRDSPSRYNTKSTKVEYDGVEYTVYWADNPMYKPNTKLVAIEYDGIVAVREPRFLCGYLYNKVYEQSKVPCFKGVSDLVSSIAKHHKAEEGK